MATEHTAHLEGDDATGFRVVCLCGFVSDVMGLGDAWATRARGLDDTGHAAFVARERRRVEDLERPLDPTRVTAAQLSAIGRRAARARWTR